MLIEEIILENFMSYEYARIPLKGGLNIICGPNGSGKSSILLGISVALGQSYTERSRRLSDLIRRGKDKSRSTLILDNRRRKGRRPVPRINKDNILLSRYLRKDGKYWFEIEGKAATKGEVNRLLSKLGVDPENMLIIMHQNMIERFLILSPQEKLRLMEAAIGLEEYRDNILNAQRKLSKILSEKDSVNKMLESAEQTLNYWREQYDRYQEKKQLLIKRRFLGRELAWSKVNSIEERGAQFSASLEIKKSELSSLTQKIEGLLQKIERLEEEYHSLINERKEQLKAILDLEREVVKREAEFSITLKQIEEIEGWSRIFERGAAEFIESIKTLKETLGEDSLPQEVKALQDFRLKYNNLVNNTSRLFSSKIDYLRKTGESLQKEIGEYNLKFSDGMAKNETIDFEMERINGEVIKFRIELAISEYERNALERSLSEINRQIESINRELSEAISLAESLGPRVVTFRSEEQILEEMRFTDGHLLALADVSEDIEKMFESYSKLYLELKEKARIVEENRRKAMGEVNLRLESWKNVIRDTLEKINLRYQSVLASVNADGEIRLIDTEDVEMAGVEIHVGFRGSEPVPLNAYTQSGGERSTATMAFLIALQQHIRSPFRAVDEFDIHMDPKNREIIADLLLSVIEGSDIQYLVITPSQLNFDISGAHIVTVQNIEGTSLVTEMI